MHNTERESGQESERNRTRNSNENTPNRDPTVLWAVIRGRPRGGGRTHILPRLVSEKLQAISDIRDGDRNRKMQNLQCRCATTGGVYPRNRCYLSIGVFTLKQCSFGALKGPFSSIWHNKIVNVLFRFFRFLGKTKASRDTDQNTPPNAVIL